MLIWIRLVGANLTKAYPRASGATNSGGEKLWPMVEHKANLSPPGVHCVRFSALSDRVPEPLPG
jgi:hypothetical protein